MVKKTNTENISMNPEQGAKHNSFVVEEATKDTDSERYVVVRDDRRVSDNEYTSMDSPEALAEHAFWERVCKNWSSSEKVETVKYNKKKHRNW